MKKSVNLFSIIVLIYASLLVARMLSASYVSAPYPNEYRESANIAMTQAIIRGENIYSLSSLTGDQPSVCYLYGPLMSVTASAIGRVFTGVDTWTIHYFISFISIILSALMMAVMVSHVSATLTGPCLAFVLTIFCHWRYGYIYGAPDSMGLCLMIGVLFFLYKGAICEKSRFPHIEIAALLTAAAFFTKQYYLMVAGVGFIYLLIVSRRLFLRYVTGGLTLLLVMLAVLRKWYPLYLTYAIYFLKGPGPGAAMGKTGIAYNTMQVKYLGGMFLVLFVAGLFLVLYLLYQGFKWIREKKKPEIKNREFLLLFFVQAAVSFAVLKYIGNNDGAFLSYYLQLFTPALAALSVYSLELVTSYLLGLEKRKNLMMAAVFGLYLVFFGYTVYKVEPRLTIDSLSDEELGAWQETYDLLDEAKEEGEIYYCPPLNYHAYSNGIRVYNDGQPFVFTRKFYDSFSDSPMAQKLFPYGGAVIAQHLMYREKLRQKVVDGDYVLVTRIDGMDEVFTTEELEKHYDHIKTELLRCGSWAWEVELWGKRGFFP